MFGMPREREGFIVFEGTPLLSQHVGVSDPVNRGCSGGVRKRETRGEFLLMTKPLAADSGNNRSAEVAALLAAAHAVLENRAFAEAASAVVSACRVILGAGAGLVALCDSGGKNLHIASLVPATFDLDTTDGFHEPLRHLSARALKRTTVFDNELSKGKRAGSATGRPSTPESALFAPIVIGGEVKGLLGMLDKPGGFSADDARFSEVFSELAAVAMLKSRTINGLERNIDQAEDEFRTLVENIPDIVARFDPELRHLYVSPAIERLTGRPSQDYVGRTNRELGLPTELVEPLDDGLRKVFATGRPEKLEFVFSVPDGNRHFDCQLVPEQGPGDSVPSVLSIARDVTDRWLAHEAERHARDIADALREATVALTRSLDRETVLTTLLDRMRTMVPFDRASVMLLEGASRIAVRAIFDGDRSIPLTAEARSEFDPADHPIVHDILSTGAPVLIPDLRHHPGWSLPADLSSEACWLGVPLFARGNVAGLLSLSNREPDYFNKAHVDLAEAMSSQASVAVENAILFEQMQAAAVRMQALSRRLVEVQESERLHIARELHDEAGQTLISLRYGLRLLEREIAEGNAVSNQVELLVNRTDAIIDSLHRLAADLRPPSLEHLGLDAALRQYSRTIESEFGLAVRFKSTGFAGVRLPKRVETALYRIVQEATTNVVRHARATRVDLIVESRGEGIMVMVEDDGVGFEPALVATEAHFGLLGLRERAEALGGILRVESVPGTGTTIVVEVADARSNSDS